MEWKFIDPSGIDPEVFDLSKIYACKVKKYNGNEDENRIRTEGWTICADVVEKCPVTGDQLPETTLYLFAAQGLK